MEWVERLLDNYGKLRLAGEAKDLEDNRKLLAIDRDVVQAHHRRNFGEHYRTTGDGDDMIHIGDRHEHLHPAPPPATPAGNRLFRFALGAALLASGVGGGWGLAILADALRPSQAPSTTPDPQSQSPPTTDRDTLFELRLGSSTR